MISSNLPTINAVLNSISAILLVGGYIAIKRGNRTLHMRIMLSAFTVSALFLLSYITYHYSAGATKFTAEGFIRVVYFSILITHTILAVTILPPIFVMLYRAWRKQFVKHARIARWTFPVWLYVSVSGVIIYLMLYHLYPPGV